MIPFSRPFVADNQQRYLLHAAQQAHLHGGGPYCGRAEARLKGDTGAMDVLLTPSASHALELALWELEPGDDVILPAFNFPSAPNAVLRAGGRVVLCDVDPCTQNLCPEKAEALITPRTKAICLTHYASVACDMAAFLALAAEHGLWLIEDAAHAMGAYYEDRHLGSIGDAGCLSFHSTKNVGCGEGGALLLNGGAVPVDRVRMYREKGTNRHAFLSGSAPFYTWETVGTSHLMPETSAAVLLAQLEQLAAVTDSRLALSRAYDGGLASLFAVGRLIPMGVPDYARPNGHIYYVLCPDKGERERLQTELARRGITSQFHFIPLHLGGMGRALGYGPGDFPASERAGDTLLRLPLYYGMDAADVERVCREIREVLG